MNFEIINLRYGKIIILMIFIPFLICHELQQILNKYFPFVFIILLIIIVIKYKSLDTSEIPFLSEKIKDTEQYKLAERLIQTIKQSYE
jgi:hypothetical protein